MRKLTAARSSRRRDLSPRPRSMSDMAHKELHAAIPSLQEHGAELESINKRVFVRTLVKKKPEWAYGEIHALSRVTTANNRVSVCWDMEHGSLILDWWAAERPRRDLGSIRRGAHEPPAGGGGAVSLSRDVLDAIKTARCDDKIYLLVINAVSLLYQAMRSRPLFSAGADAGRRVAARPQVCGKELRRAYRRDDVGLEAHATVGPRDVASKRALCACVCVCLQDRLLPDLVDISLDASTSSLTVGLDNVPAKK